MKKKVINAGVNGMIAKAQSWNQVAKQLSGISGKIDCAGEKLSPIEIMRGLGVSAEKNSYRPQDLLNAWSEKMRIEGKVCIKKSLPYQITVSGKSYRLHTLNESDYKGVSMAALVPLVSASDKVEKTDAVVSAINVLQGLKQSLYIDQTLKSIEKSVKKVQEMTEGYINVGTTKVENWQKVEKSVEGVWSIAKEEKKEEKSVETKDAIKKTQTRRNTRRAKKAA